MCACDCRGQSTILAVILQGQAPYFETGYLTGLELTDMGKLAR